jgi:hypothetical protein
MPPTTLSEVGHATGSTANTTGGLAAHDRSSIQVGNNYVNIHSGADPRDQCLADLRTTDPRHDKARIEQTKGGLLPNVCSWILDNLDFQRWRDDPRSRLLWIKGDPGKGKTMLLCGIIDKLEPATKLADPRATTFLSYFFCQATDSRINTATDILRNLIYLLIQQQESLVQHLQNEYKHARKDAFQDPNAWIVLSKILDDILCDPDLQGAYLVIDALDECETDLPRLLDLIVRNSTKSCSVKWLVSSRNRHDIEQGLRLDGSRLQLSLELEDNAEQVSRAVDAFINHKALQLKALYDEALSVAFSPITLSFDTDSHLLTVFGRIEARQISSLRMVNSRRIPTDLDSIQGQDERSKPSTEARWSGWALSLDGCWITRGGDSMLWLPPQWRPGCSAVQGSTVCVGSKYGRVLIINCSK